MEGKCQYLIWVILLLGQLHGYESCTEKERKALLELKYLTISVNGSGFVFSTTRTNDTESDCCQWEGVKCNRTSGRVIRLSIGRTEESEGSLDLSLLHPFEEVRSLNLSNSGFSGLFDNVEGYKSLRRLRNLEILDLSSNKFNISIFPFLNAATSLTTLFLRKNYLTMSGPFPAGGLKDLTNLELLDLSITYFNGYIPVRELSTLRKLKALDLSSNEFSGSMDWQGICKLKNLQELDFSQNKLVGEIPVSLFSISELYLADLSTNSLSGDLPPHVNSLLHAALLLQDNNLSGVIPETLLENVKVLDLRNNRLSGEIPEFINTQSIRMLLLRGNHLTGRIPRQLCVLRSIHLLDLANNRLNGSIPSCLGNSSFGLGDAGTVEDGYSGFAVSLESENHAYVKSLLVLHWFTQRYDAGTEAKIEFATKHRYDTYTGRNLNLLFGMDLSGNELSGDIPVELGGLQELHSLNLSHNNLSGVIPESFSGLKNVASLDLSFNSLQGRIPQELTELNSLAVFNVSYNNLSGIIPRGRQFNTFHTQSYLGNPLLCGKPINRSCSSITLQEPDNEVEADESPVDMISFYWSLAAAYVTILVGIFASLSFDSPWRRFWFYIVDAFIHKARNMLW